MAPRPSAAPGALAGSHSHLNLIKRPLREPDSLRRPVQPSLRPGLGVIASQRDAEAPTAPIVLAAARPGARQPLARPALPCAATGRGPIRGGGDSGHAGGSLEAITGIRRSVPGGAICALPRLWPQVAGWAWPPSG